MSHKSPWSADLGLFRHDFEHEEQVRLCARHLEVMREDMGDEWWSFGQPNPGSHGWTRGRITLAKHLVRHACESADFPATVDYVTKNVLGHISTSRNDYPRRRIAHLTQWGLFTHEHMVPGGAVLSILTDPDYAPNRGTLYELLSPLSYRALVTGTKKKQEAGADGLEIARLDKLFRSCLPEPCQVKGWPAAMHISQVPPSCYPLMRYDAAGLLDELIPVTARAQRALDGYRTYKSDLGNQGALAA